MPKADLPVPEDMLENIEPDRSPEKRLRDLIIIFDECETEEITFALRKFMMIPDEHLAVQSTLVNEYAWSECNVLAGYGLYLAEYVSRKELSELYYRSIEGKLNVEERSWILVYYDENICYQ